MKLIVTLLFTLSLNLYAAEPAPKKAKPQVKPKVDIQGILVEKGTRRILSGVNVYILPHKLKAVTDAEGVFRFKKVPAGKFKWVINLTGYDKLELESSTQELLSQEATLRLFLERTSYQVYETTIYGQQEKRDDTTKTLKAAQISAMPGASRDPLKAIQNLPGINRGQPLSAVVIIQGSGPQDTSYLIDDHEVPLIFHFGGINSILFVESLDRVNYLSAGYGPEFGRATGGLIGLNTRTPNTKRLQGSAFMDFYNAGGLIEGPVGENSSMLFSARYSLIGILLESVVNSDSSSDGSTDNFALTAVPTFADLTHIWETKLSSKAKFKLLTIGSYDNLELLLNQPSDADPAFFGTFLNRTAFFRLIPQLELKHSENMISRYSVGVGKNWIRFETGDIWFRLNTVAMTLRAELERKIGIYTGYLGVDNTYAQAYVETRFPSFFVSGGIVNPFSTGESQTVSTEGKSNLIAIYLRNKFKLGNWTLMPSGRIDHYGPTSETLPTPRLALRYRWDDSLSFKTSGGLYHQPPEPLEISDPFGNPNLQSPRAIAWSAGVDKDFRGGGSTGFIASLGTFYKFLDRQVVNSTTTIYDNSGKGRVYGAETQVRYEQKPWSFTMAYTLSRSTRWDTVNAEYPYQYDQTHLLGLYGSFTWGNWVFSTRFRYGTGNPQTPVVGSVWDGDNDVYIPIRGDLYSDRADPFLQWDIRIDKKFIHNDWIFSMYLDVQNVTNNTNVQSTVYSYDYSVKEGVAGLPITPIFGVKGEF